MLTKAIIVLLVSTGLNLSSAQTTSDQTTSVQTTSDQTEQGSCFMGPNCDGEMVGVMTVTDCKNHPKGCSSWGELDDDDDDDDNDGRNLKRCKGWGGGGGDPHLTTWGGERYSYHGECDLVFLHNSEFADGTGLDIHIRTELVNNLYSFISNVAVKIGDELFEVSTNGYYVNGDPLVKLPTTISGYAVTEIVVSSDQIAFYVDFADHGGILIRQYKDIVDIELSGSADYFKNSVGLLGTFTEGKMVARDGETVYPDHNDFGGDWQVQEQEPKLFKVLRDPQLPEEKCRLPSVTSRRLRGHTDPELVEAARKACSHKQEKDFEFCVFDVLVTGDLKMASAGDFQIPFLGSD